MNAQIINGMTIMYRGRCAIVGCGRLKQIHNVVKKWTRSKHNEGVRGCANNQAPIVGCAQE